MAPLEDRLDALERASSNADAGPPPLEFARAVRSRGREVLARRVLGASALAAVLGISALAAWNAGVQRAAPSGAPGGVGAGPEVVAGTEPVAPGESGAGALSEARPGALAGLTPVPAAQRAMSAGVLRGVDPLDARAELPGALSVTRAARRAPVLRAGDGAGALGQDLMGGAR
jgi:hypothetical protein